MTLSLRTIWMGVALVGLPLLAMASWSAAAASRAETDESRRLERVGRQVSKLHELEGALPNWVLAPKPAGTLSSLVSAALGAAGLPASAMASLSADSESSAQGGLNGAGPANTSVRVAQRRATLVLTSITLPQLGAFLETWRDKQPAWTVVQLDVGPEQAAAVMPGRASSSAASPGATTTGGDLPLHAVIVLESSSLQGSLQGSPTQQPRSAAPAGLTSTSASSPAPTASRSTSTPSAPTSPPSTPPSTSKPKH